MTAAPASRQRAASSAISSAVSGKKGVWARVTSAPTMAAVRIASGHSSGTALRKVLDRITKDGYCRRPKGELAALVRPPTSQAWLEPRDEAAHRRGGVASHLALAL